MARAVFTCGICGATILKARARPAGWRLSVPGSRPARLALSDAEMRAIRGNAIWMIFQ